METVLGWLIKDPEFNFLSQIYLHYLILNVTCIKYLYAIF